MPAFLGGLLTGMAFGAVLYKVGATRYSRVMGMITLKDTKVMKFAFTGIGVASLLYGLAAALGLSEALGLVPRTMPFLGLAHLLGGALFGAAMGITGLCPGTCAAKTGGRGGDKKLAGPAAVAGLFAGVLIYGLLRGSLVESGIIASNARPLTLHGVLGLPYAAVALVWGASFILIAFLVDRFTPERIYVPSRERKSALDWIRAEWSWAASGSLAGLLIVLATAQGGYLGFSGAVLALTGWLATFAGHPMELVPRIDADIIWRAALIVGVFPGAFVARVISIPSMATIEAPLPRTLDLKAIARAFFGTTAMSLGAMIGGGCTTGAFIAAWPTLSVGSLAMAGTFFAVSMGVGSARMFIIRSLDLAEAQRIGDRAYD